MLDNASTLSSQGMFVSAETMLNQSTLPYLDKIHKEIVNDMKCSRHEVHPMYPKRFRKSIKCAFSKRNETSNSSFIRYSR